MAVLDEIRRCLRDGTLAHAYILEGDAGNARDSIARQIIQAILCESPSPENRPCDLCSSCRRIRNGFHEDVVEMQMTGKNSYLTKDSEAFMVRLSMNAYGDHLVGVIPNADAMSEVVQNKLLKTLEEPSPGTVILLTVTNREMLLDTVRSRCVLLRMADSDNAMDHGDVAEIWSSSYFYEFRKGIDKSMKTQEEALQFLDAIEIEEHQKLQIQSVVLIEEARRDIMQGMGWKQALKKLYLELHA